MKGKIILALAVVVAAAGVLGFEALRERTWVVRFAPDSVWANGRIDAGMARQVTRTLKQGDTLHIRSVGGDVDAALDIAEALRISRVGVRAHDVCASACAQYVLLLAPQRAAGGAFVVFHESDLAWVDASKNVPAAFSEAQRAQIGSRSLRIRELYRSAGISNSLSRCLDQKQGVSARDLIKSADQDYPRLAARLSGAAPSPALLQAAGVSGLDDIAWTSDPTRRTRLANRLRGKIAFVDVHDCPDLEVP